MKGRRKVRGVALVLTGLLMGSLVVTPVSAHFLENTKHLGVHAWAQFIRDRVYTRAQTHARFYTRAQSDALFAGSEHDHDFTGAFLTNPIGGGVLLPWGEATHVLTNAEAPRSHYDAAYYADITLIDPGAAPDSGAVTCDVHTGVGLQMDDSISTGDPAGTGLQDSTSTFDVDGFSSVAASSGPMRPVNHNSAFIGLVCVNTLKEGGAEVEAGVVFFGPTKLRLDRITELDNHIFPAP